MQSGACVRVSYALPHYMCVVLMCRVHVCMCVRVCACVCAQAMTGGSIFLGSGVSINTGVSSTFANAVSGYSGQVCVHTYTRTHIREKKCTYVHT
jgi:hypothetical protein